MCYGRFPGYEKGEERTMVINKDQTQVVERTYGLFIAGLSPKAIAKHLPKTRNLWYTPSR